MFCKHNYMGIAHLNKYIKQKCPDSIRAISLSGLYGKIIAVDISIYLYKYERDDLLMENIYIMLSIFRYYNITPLFIFDGKPPTEKKALLIQRRKERNKAVMYYDILNDKLEGPQIKEEDKQEILLEMLTLKKQMVLITRDKIEKVKELLRAYGASYFDAPGEADELCAMLVIKKKVWACLSEDMDMFVYGCPRVLRYFSLFNHTAVLYYTKGILRELNLSQDEFREICVLSGTDYNLQYRDKNIHLCRTFAYFQKYKDWVIKEGQNTNMNFYTWLQTNTKYIKNIHTLININKLFDLQDAHNRLVMFENISIINGVILEEKIQEIMKKEEVF